MTRPNSRQPMPTHRTFATEATAEQWANSTLPGRWCENQPLAVSWLASG